MIFYRQKDYEIVQEELEDDFWHHNGIPKFIKPVFIPSLIPEKNGELRPTYIAI